MELKPKNGARSFRFCDVASTHTMRRTAITTMLCLGMPEQFGRRQNKPFKHIAIFLVLCLIFNDLIF